MEIYLRIGEGFEETYVPLPGDTGVQKLGN